MSGGRITYPTTWYKVERRDIDTTSGPATIYVPINRLLCVDARQADGSPAAFPSRDEAHAWCKSNSPTAGWRS